MVRIFDNDTSTFNPALGGQYCEDNGLDVNGATAGTAGDGICDTNEPAVDPFGFWTAGPTHPSYAAGAKVKALAVRPRTKAPVIFDSLYQYNDPTDFGTRVDASLAGVMRDCAECHIGGGSMEYIPVAPSADPDTRQDLRSADLSVASTGYNAYNTFIGQYEGTDADGNNVVKGEVYNTSFANTGVLEVDCLMCHMEGFSWEHRTEAIRLGELDASRAVGAGLATEATSGTTVTYDSLMVNTNGTLNTLALSSIKGAPPSENCASCHFDMHKVDWKKRGTSWNDNMAYETDVHFSQGCMGCHERTDGNPAGSWGANLADDLTAMTGMSSSTVLGHDPAKGDAPYSSLWNKTDKQAAKTCRSCHTEGANPPGAADPTAKHAALGFTATITQNGRDGVRDASHLDIIDCAACHARKLGSGPTDDGSGNTHGSLYEWGTGGAMVDATGPDHDGRLTDHENLYVERTMEDNTTVVWQGNKLIPANGLVTMFWRDKNDTSVDINADGQMGGMDAVNSSHIASIMETAGLEALTVDGIMNDAEIDTARTALMNNLATYGIDPTGAALRLSFMGVLFKANHGIAPAGEAWGAGGCTDCHSANGGFYNGAYELKGRDLDISYTPTQVAPFTKVNGTQPSDFHPTLFAKDLKGKRSIALQVASDGAGTLRPIDRSEALYENDMTANPMVATSDGTAYASRAGWVSYLNNVSGNHGIHLKKGYNTCTICHANGGGDYSVVADTSVMVVDSTGASVPLEIVFTPGPAGSPNWGSCATNCHDQLSYSSVNIVKANFSALASEEVNYQVEFRTDNSEFDSSIPGWTDPTIVLTSCYTKVTDSEGIVSTVEKECAYSWDFSNGPGTVSGGNGETVMTVTYPDADDYTATLTMCMVDEPTVCDTQAVTVTAREVEPPAATANAFAAAVSGNTVTISQDQIVLTDIVRVYAYWGDRKRTVYKAPYTTFDHEYRNSGDYDVDIVTLDSARNTQTYTYTVTIP